MNTERFLYRSSLRFPAAEVYRWHGRPGALERLTPPWEKVRVLDRQGGIEDGGEVALAVRAAGLWRRWVARHHDHEPERQFCDTQIAGPFARWEHCHRFVPQSPLRSCLEDDIAYALPLGRLGKWLGGGLVRRKLRRTFRYRHDVTARDLALHQRYGQDHSWKVLVTGSTGLVGSALVPFLTTGGHRVTRLVRSPDQAGPDAVYWNPAEGVLDPARLEGFDAVVHLAGENIAARRWNSEQKTRILDSRIGPTRLLCETLARLERPPRVVVAASATGYYGNRGDAWLEEGSAPGEGFLAEVCRAWESATRPASAAGIRVVNLRLGIVLTPAGGALARMLPPFRLGLGGRIGGGNQFWSWIALDDVLGAIYHTMTTPGIEGPVNAVSPVPATNREFTKALGRVLGRPTLFPLPAFAARLALGEMARDLLLASTRVQPGVLIRTGYPFFFHDLGPALAHLLGVETERREGGSEEPDQRPAAALAGK